jgi:accessory gene regulator B
MQFDEDKKAVIEYGLLAVFNIIIIGLIISAVGLIFGFLYESVIIFMGVGILKKSTGGAHAETLAGCIIVSISSITLFAAVSRYALGFPISTGINTGITLLVSIVCFAVFSKMVPVDTPNKPIRKPEKIRKLRRQSFTLLGLYAALSITAGILAPLCGRLYSMAFCIRLTLLWQTFMLTLYGQRLIHILTKNLT